VQLSRGGRSGDGARVDPVFVLKALAEGADGVLVTGCHPGDCHYLEQNYKTMRRFELLKKTLAQMGVEDGRVKLVWASAAEGMILAEEIDKFVAQVKQLGPLNWKRVAWGAAGPLPAESLTEMEAVHG
jgi:F420-non-reducing hydrogenase iron-sulfur subunit